jgi:hypothetical protein
MSDLSHFESRSGTVNASGQVVFAFVTDIRNFERFIPDKTITDWHAERDSCSFSVSMLGKVGFRLTHKEMYSKVVFSGDALKKNDFELILNITDIGSSGAAVRVELSADLNPMMKMIAVRPIEQFLEMLIGEMEKFNGWNEIK